MQQLDIPAADGTAIPLNWFEAPRPNAALLILPALGIQARLYDKLATGLAAQGHCSVCVMEQRGHGRSGLRPGRKIRYGLDDILEQDMPAAMAWLAQRAQGLPLLLGGHSLGGHLSTLYAGQHPEQLAGVVHLACAFPYVGDYAAREAKLVRLLCRLMPFFSIVPGYYPGQRMGFGGRESITLMRQWCEWASTGSFDFGGRSDLAAGVAAFAGPVISLSFERDSFATEAAIERALSPFTHARITRRKLGPEQQGEHLGHVGWARGPEGVVQALAQWLETELPISGQGR
ncbi:MAG: alpha/beta fold hydrolase [Halieaceae bacterium]|nr:alpha/beta fold hydrolase [Halieaceae bacterium]